MPVTTIYRTEDGEVWDSLEEAERHKRKLMCGKVLKKSSGLMEK